MAEERGARVGGSDIADVRVYDDDAWQAHKDMKPPVSLGRSVFVVPQEKMFVMHARSSVRKSGSTRPGRDLNTASVKRVCGPPPEEAVLSGGIDNPGSRKFRADAVSFSLMGDRLMVGPRTLTPLVGVRVPLPQP